jgi:hypothetical protein
MQPVQKQHTDAAHQRERQQAVWLLLLLLVGSVAAACPPHPLLTYETQQKSVVVPKE